MLQFGGHQAVGGIDRFIASASQMDFVVGTLQLLLPMALNLGVFVPPWALSAAEASNWAGWMAVKKAWTTRRSG